MDAEMNEGPAVAAIGPRDSLPETKAVILRARGLKRSFGKVCAVDGLDLTVHAGEIYGFLGVNGAGKTTAIRMLMGIIKPEAGSLELMGEQTRRTTLRQKQSIGYVSQEQTFYPWMTCRALGRFVGGLYPTWDNSEFERLLRLLDLPPDRKASQLSGGMRVKLALALALAPRPRLLVLDEPTSGLDPLARREFLEIIQRETREHGCTTFFSSHIIGEIERVADRVGIIHRGRMQFEGSLNELCDSIRRVQVPSEAAAPPPISPPPLVPSALPCVDSQAALDVAVPVAATMGAQPVALSGIPDATLDSTPANAPWELPSGFQVLSDELREGHRTMVLRAPSGRWEALNHGGIEIRQLSLEDIFVALVGKGAIVA